MKQSKYRTFLILSAMAFLHVNIFAMQKSISISKEQELKDFLELPNQRFHKELALDSSLINSQDQDGNTLLMQAIAHKKLAHIKTLLFFNANPWIFNNKKECAFHAVCKTGILDIARLLLRHHKNDPEWSLLRRSGSKFAPTGCLSILFHHYRQSDNQLFQALLFGDLKAIDEMLKCDPSIINKDIPLTHCDPAAPIIWAVLLEDMHLIDYLLKNGANIESTLGGMSAYDLAYIPAIREKMLPFGGDILKTQEDLFNAIQKGDASKVKGCINGNPALVNKKGYNSTPLAWAITYKRTNIAAFLINSGANLIEGAGESPLLFLACIHNDIETMRLLAGYKEVDCNFYRSKKYWPFDYPISQEVKDELFRLFTSRYYRNLNIQGQLRFARRALRKELIEQALLKGADINSVDDEGNTALLWVGRFGNPEIIAFLISKGALIDVYDDIKKRTCLQWLLRMHKKGMQKNGRQITSSELFPCFLLLIHAGANIQKKDAENRTIIDWINIKKFTQKEIDIFNKIFRVATMIAIERKQLLIDIHNFQNNELEYAKKNPDKFSDEDIVLMEEASIQDPFWKGISVRCVTDALKDTYKKICH